MANKQHVAWLKEGVAAWNLRREAEDFEPDLSGGRFDARRFKESPLWEPVRDRINLEGADLRGANLERAKLGRAKLEGANLERANLDKTSVSMLNVKSTWAMGADKQWEPPIAQVDFRVLGLTQEQLDCTEGDSATLIPGDLTRPDHWEKTHDGARPVLPPVPDPAAAGAQRPDGLSFSGPADAPIDLAPEPDQRRDDAIAQDLHAETREAIARLRDWLAEDPRRSNTMAIHMPKVDRLAEALGGAIAAMRPGRLLPRWRALQIAIVEDRERDEDSDLPPMGDAARERLSDIAAAAGDYIAADPVLDRMAKAGDDADPPDIPPAAAAPLIADAAREEVLTEDAETELTLAAENARRDKTPKRRSGAFFAISTQNFGREVLSRAAAIAVNARKAAKIAIEAGKIITTGFVLTRKFTKNLAKWFLKNREKLKDWYENDPDMPARIDAWAEWIKRLPLDD